MVHNLPEFISNHRAWTLTILSSVMCILGATVIYLDVIVRWINPRSKFSIRANNHFLISGFSLSCGSLIITSLYRLLPKALQYFEMAQKESKKEAEDPSFLLRPNTGVMLTFISGVLICGAFNWVIHYFTSESIVHCAHGDEESETEHTHLPDSQNSHSHSHSSSGDEDEGAIKHTQLHKHSHSHNHDHLGLNFYEEEAHVESPLSHPVANLLAETAPLTNSSIQTSYQTTGSTDRSSSLPARAASVRKKSILGIIDKLTHAQSQPCQGIHDTNCGGLQCINEQLSARLSNDIQNLDFYRDVSLKRTNSSLVAYTTDRHSPDPLISIDTSEPATLDSLTPHTYVITNIPSAIRIATEPNLGRHEDHKDDHHHQVNTPVSRLLSIGLQTCLALTLHKFPEGFITYATTKADPELGLAIFLSLAIHNVVEGFSMALPLYLALNSRAKAFSITFLLGGLSQPVGALFASLLLEGRKIDKKQSMVVFGILIGVTSGFLLVIALQLFASAINFGGTTNKVIRWCMIGVFVILLSSMLTDSA